MSARETDKPYSKRKGGKAKKQDTPSEPIELDDVLNKVVPPDQIVRIAKRMRNDISRTLTCPSSPNTQQQFRDATEVFLQLFADTTEEELDRIQQSRFGYALNSAADRFPAGSVRLFFAAKVKYAGQASFKRLKPTHPALSEIEVARRRRDGKEKASAPTGPTPSSVFGHRGATAS